MEHYCSGEEVEMIIAGEENAKLKCPECCLRTVGSPMGGEKKHFSENSSGSLYIQRTSWENVLTEICFHIV